MSIAAVFVIMAGLLAVGVLASFFASRQPWRGEGPVGPVDGQEGQREGQRGDRPAGPGAESMNPDDLRFPDEWDAPGRWGTTRPGPGGSR